MADDIFDPSNPFDMSTMVPGEGLALDPAIASPGFPPLQPPPAPSPTIEQGFFQDYGPPARLLAPTARPQWYPSPLHFKPLGRANRAYNDLIYGRAEDLGEMTFRTDPRGPQPNPGVSTDMPGSVILPDVELWSDTHGSWMDGF